LASSWNFKYGKVNQPHFSFGHWCKTRFACGYWYFIIKYADITIASLLLNNINTCYIAWRYGNDIEIQNGQNIRSHIHIVIATAHIPKQWIPRFLTRRLSHLKKTIIKIKIEKNLLFILSKMCNQKSNWR